MRKYYLAGVALFAAFATLTMMIVFDVNSLSTWDYSVFKEINKPQGKILNQVMIDLTKYGREELWISVTALLFVFGGRTGKKTAGLLFVTFVILIPLGTGLKDAIDRPRPVPVSPQNLLVATDNDPSFPSGHAVIVSAGAFVVLARFTRGKQAVFSLALAAEAMLVIYSRMYVGDHYPLDVVGGIFVGTGTSALVVGSDWFFFPLFSRLYSKVLRR